MNDHTVSENSDAVDAPAPIAAETSPVDTLSPSSDTSSAEAQPTSDEGGHAEAPVTAGSTPKTPRAPDPFEGFRTQMRERVSVMARVIKWQRNGLEVELEGGALAFMPNEMIDRDPNRNVANYFSKTIPVKITSVRAKPGATSAELIVSHRAVIEEDLRTAGREGIQHLNVGDVVEGKVKSFSKDNVVLDLGPGIDAVIRPRDLAWQHVDHPYEILKRGDTVTAKILSLDRGRRRVQLGVKQLTEDPEVLKYTEYMPEQLVKGKIISTGHYGAEMELPNGLVAFLPMSEITWDRIGAVTDAVNIGDEVEVKLLKVDADDRRITATRKQLVENPLRVIESTFRMGSDHDGTIKEVNRGGVVVALAHGAEGFIPRRELSHDRIERLEDTFKTGKPLEGLRVIEFDNRPSETNRGPRITLSLIAAEKEAQTKTLKNYKPTARASSYSLSDSLAALKEQLLKQEKGE